jgi:predicted PurR-regulated permease PerM
VFIAIIGGLAHFGVSGLVFGPLILALVVALLDIYRTEFVSEAGKS